MKRGQTDQGVGIIRQRGEGNAPAKREDGTCNWKKKKKVNSCVLGTNEMKRKKKGKKIPTKARRNGQGSPRNQC